MMILRFLFIKSKDDFCQNIEQFKSYLSTNCRIIFCDGKIIFGKKELYYKIAMHEVSNEVIYDLTLEANQENKKDQVEALEKAESDLQRINERLSLFLINTIQDEISRYYGQELYPYITETEALLREIIYLFMSENIGSKWFEKQTPKDVKSEIENTFAKNHSNDEKLDSDVLSYADFISLSGFLFLRYPLKSNIQELVNKINNMENVDKQKLIPLIEKFESKSNWERYFSDVIDVEDLEQKWKNLYEYRNMIAHTKKIRKKDFEKAKEISDELIVSFKKCIEGISENKLNISDEESKAVEEIAEVTISPKSVNSISSQTSRKMLEKMMFGRNIEEIDEYPASIMIPDKNNSVFEQWNKLIGKNSPWYKLYFNTSNCDSEKLFSIDEYDENSNPLSGSFP